ncbi:MAG TPA: twin-arginine translocase subunit TatC [Candidatus Limnocylindrales bacterium]|jgi:sec-independent protein translocase protein TatC|nr:twin-arginine translocase subunit TatC [Candidatus Limnocylindrales bacterium]
MVDEPEAQPLEALEDEEGGPVKSFLEHLEDLRWVLIKSLSAGGVAMLICLLGGNYMMRILEWPLRRAPARHHEGGQTIRVTFGTNQVGHFIVATNEAWSSVLGTNSNVQLEIVPVLSGTNLTLGLKIAPDAEADSGKRERLAIEIINLSPAGSFIVATKVAFYGGLVVAAPFIFYFVACFVFPALKMREKKYVYRGLAFGAGLFLTGVSFCYFVLMPVALAASAQYAEWLGLAVNQWRAEDYIGFVCKFMLGMGLGFELPVVVLTLVKIGVLNYAILSKARRYVIVINVILGAVLTTPEVITQILMAVPLQILYEVSVWIAWYWERQEKKRVAAEESAAAA